MTDLQFSGKWEGVYAQWKQYTEEKQEKEEVVFIADITVEDGILSGTSEEQVTRELMGRPATLSGFVEGDVISFIKQYPYYYYLGDDGEIKVDVSREHPPVHYSGMFDAATGIFSGEWEIEVYLDREEYGDDPYLLRGGWELKKIE